MSGLNEQVASHESVPFANDVAFLQCTPLLNDGATTESFFGLLEGSEAKALVIIGYASGSIPRILNPYITKTVERGVPAFVLSDNKANDTGPQEIKYIGQKESVESGATILKDVNINHIVDVAVSIQGAIDEGMSGTELTQAVIEKYGSTSWAYFKP